jgi:cell division protein FtsZ
MKEKVMLNENEKTMLNENAKIKVIGVGGGGGNAVNRMIKDGFKGVEFYVINTDSQVLEYSTAEKVLIGPKATKGLGAGANPEVGKKAAEENREEIRSVIDGADLIYIATGMGGGTGTGAAPIVAQIAKELDILSIGIVTLPFEFEGKKRMRQALEGKKEFAKYVDTLITIPNDKILDSLEEKEAAKITMIQAFELADSVLAKAAVGVTDLINKRGHINLDFADIRTVVKVGGSALMGIGEAKGDEAAKNATMQAMTNPLLLHGITGAKGVIMNFTSSENLSFMEITRAAALVREQADEDAEILFGHVIESGEEWDTDKVVVTIVATGFQEDIGNKDAWKMNKEVIQEKAPSIATQEVYVAPSQNTWSESYNEQQRDKKVEARPTRLPSLLDLEKELDEDPIKIPSFLQGSKRN